jgi:hypothetical protein
MSCLDGLQYWHFHCFLLQNHQHKYQHNFVLLFSPSSLVLFQVKPKEQTVLKLFELGHQDLRLC